MILEILTSTAVASIATYIYASISIKKNKEAQIRKNNAEYVSTKLTEARRKANQFYEKVSLLEKHAVNYFNTLQEVGLSTLIDIRDELTTTFKDCQEHFDAGRYVETLELCKFLVTPFSMSYPELAKLTSADLVMLEDWQQRGDQLILACVIRLGVMAGRTESAGVQRTVEKRRATLHSLDELKQLLGNYRPNAE